MGRDLRLVASEYGATASPRNSLSMAPQDGRTHKTSWPKSHSQGHLPSSHTANEKLFPRLPSPARAVNVALPQLNNSSHKLPHSKRKRSLLVFASARERARASLGWGRAGVKASVGVMGCDLILITLDGAWTVTLTHHVDL